MKNKELKHFNAIEVFQTIVDYGGPNLWENYCGSFNHYCSHELYFPDWYVINEFQTREWALWWEKFSEIFNIQPGDSIYLDM